MLKLTVIGDSIAKGYGSTDSNTNSFGAILGEKLSADVTNLGIVGLDTNGLLNKLDTNEFQEAIENSDVICLSIGSNDLLKPFLSVFADSIDVKGEEKELFSKIQEELSKKAKSNPAKAADSLSTAMKRLTDNKQLKAACEDFPKKFDKVIDKIYEINPDVIIYANNIYNPYYGVAYEYEGISVFNISSLCEPYIQSLNRNFNSMQDYTVVDMYSVFRQPGYTHVQAGSIENMSGINMDPHPNDAGYRLMADYIYTKMDSIVPYVVESEFIQNDDYSGDIVIVFNERVRLVENGQIIITSKDKSEQYICNITENRWIEQNEQNEFLLNLELDQFIKNGIKKESDNTEEIILNGDYTVTITEGTIKDKGNNHLENQSLLEFSVKGETVEVSAVNNAKVKVTTNYIVIVSVIIIIVVSILILVKRLSKKRKKY